MLIAFHSSPYSAPLQTGTPNRGFELNVDILFTDSDSYDFVQNSKCEFHINASSPGEGRRKHCVVLIRENFGAFTCTIINCVFAFRLLTSHFRACIQKINAV